MKKQLLFILLAISGKIISQNADCISASILCNTSAYALTPNSGNGNISDVSVFDNVSNPQTNIENFNQGCLLQGENNSQWFLIVIQNTGLLEFAFGERNSANPQAGFYDWSIWPYNASACNSIKNNTLPPVRCNWNGTSSGGSGLASAPTIQNMNSTTSTASQASASNFQTPLAVNACDKFLICINNFSNVNGLLSFVSLGTASVSCTGNCAGNNPCVQNFTIDVNGTTSTFNGTTPLDVYSCIQSATLSAPPNFSSYLWTGPGGITSIAPSLSTGVPGTYTLTVGQGTLCSDSKFIELHYLSTETSELFICKGTTATLSASGFNSYVWSTGDTTPTISVSPTLTTTYTVTALGTNGYSCTANIIQHVAPCPNTSPCSNSLAMTVNGNTSVLNGGMINIFSCEPTATITAPLNFSSYQWSGPGGITSSTASLTTSVPGTYTLMLAKAGICLEMNIINLNILKVYSSESLLCTGNSATLTATGLNSYIWSTGQTGSSIVVSPANTSTYTVSGVAANGYLCATSIIQNVAGPCTGINSYAAEEKGILIYPNPNNGEFTLNIKKQVKNAELLIENTLGQLLYTQPVLQGDTKVKTKNLAAGIYYYTVTENNVRVVTGKIKVE